jgi:hypothetical protein
LKNDEKTKEKPICRWTGKSKKMLTQTKPKKKMDKWEKLEKNN